MTEFNLLQDYPKTKRKNIDRVITAEAKEIASRLDFNYWDGDRRFGFGGYVYDGRWKVIAQAAKERYNLHKKSRVLVERCGCEKGFLVFDLANLIPGIQVYGLHCAEYPLNHAMEGYGRYARINGETTLDPKEAENQARDKVVPYLLRGDPRDMPFKDRFFDTVISINSACAYPEEGCRRVIREIKRVTKDGGIKSYIQNDSWRNEEERERLLKWSLLCRTFLSSGQWKNLFDEEGYNGDWGFTIIE